MNYKAIISYSTALMILALGYMGKEALSKEEEHKSTSLKKEIATVFVDKVLNETKAITYKSNGSLVAKNKIDLFAEVQGIFQSSAHLFKPGVTYNKGQILLRLNSDEFRANLQIQKSNLYQKLISILPDLKLDYPEQFNKWETYILAFDVDKAVKQLPSFDNQQEKLFITGKGIPTAYYSVKNLQERLSKYTIYAPFNGILTSANVNKGTLISPGQRLGTFISPNVYELEVSVSTSNVDFIKKGKILRLQTLDKKQQWTGTVTRINPVVDPRSQSIIAYIQVSGKGLKEGMYLEAVLESRNDKAVYEIDRSLLVENEEVYIVVSDSLLERRSVSVVHVSEKTALIEGLVDGTIILSQALPGAYDGKIVKIAEQ